MHFDAMQFNESSSTADEQLNASYAGYVAGDYSEDDDARGAGGGAQGRPV